MSPDYQIITSSLVLRLVDSEEDEELQTLIRQSSSLHDWIEWCHADFSLQEAASFIQSTRVNWIKSQAFGFGVYRRCDDRLIGMVAINELYHTFNMASLGYWIGDEFQQQGYASKAVSALCDFCFDTLKLTRLEIVCDPDNQASRALALACGAEFEAYAANRFLVNRKPKTGAVYAIIPS